MSTNRISICANLSECGARTFPRRSGGSVEMMSRTGPLILIIEDDSAVLASLNFMLEVEGFKTCPFDSVTRLLEAERLPELACLVVDYRTTTMNGIELVKHLRRRGILAPAVLIVEHADKSVRESALAAGFAGVVDKIVFHDNLVNEIRRVLAIA
jgi:two-component system, LuxR family, response regulator FixJ